MKKLFVLLLPLILLISCSSSKQENKTKPPKKIEPTVFLTKAQLDKSGFIKIDGENFILYFLRREGFILSNWNDRNVIRYKSPDDIRRYSAYGEGPGEFVMPSCLFEYDDRTLCIFDPGLKKVIFFDRDLNFKKEKKVNPSIWNMSPYDNGNRFISYGLFSGKNFGILDRDFQIKETLVDQLTESNLPQMTIIHLNTGRLLKNGNYAFTQRLYTEKECRTDIYSPGSKEIRLTLKWEQEKALNKKNRMARTNLYYAKYMFEYNNYYLILNDFRKHLHAPNCYDCILFDKKGKIVFRDKKFPYDVIKVLNNPDDTLYYITENGDLAYIRIDQLIKPS